MKKTFIFAMLAVLPAFIGCDDGVVLGNKTGDALASNSTAPSATAAKVSDTPTGTYKVDLVKNTCVNKDASDADNLQVTVEGDKVAKFEMDDDNVEVVKSFENNIITFVFEGNDSTTCEISVEKKIAKGTCKKDKEACDLYYVKCSDEPNGDGEECAVKPAATTATSAIKQMID
ncbi:MAG: hypothetical protein HYT75_02840 [Deltaproteobacteria bacterium]|nr:hypothetical protein [Deltaproteobacteria bacterium]